MKFVNLTPHVVNILSASGMKTIPASGKVARVAVVRASAPSIDDVEVFTVRFGAIEDLPEPDDGVVYIVSALVAERARRADVLFPEQLVRDETGQPVGCRGLSRYALGAIGDHIRDLNEALERAHRMALDMRFSSQVEAVEWARGERLYGWAVYRDMTSYREIAGTWGHHVLPDEEGMFFLDQPSDVYRVPGKFVCFVEEV